MFLKKRWTQKTKMTQDNKRMKQKRQHNKRCYEIGIILLGERTSALACNHGQQINK